MNMIVIGQAAEMGTLVIVCLFMLGFCLTVAPLALWVHLANFRGEKRAHNAQALKALESCAKSLAALERQIAPQTIVKILRPRRVLRVEEAPANAGAE